MPFLLIFVLQQGETYVQNKQTYDQDGYRIALCMHDNDFTSTVLAFLRVVQEMEQQPNVAQLKQLWSELSFGLYLASQGYRHWPETEKHDGADNHTRRYLLEEMRFYHGREVEDWHKKRDGWDNGETFVYDTRLPGEAQVYCY